jgi:glycosyltransferase involved in cell wall biosynthesis
MIILYLVNSVAGGGGLQKIVLAKASYMIEQWGFEVHVLCGRQGSEDIHGAHPGLNIHYMSRKKSKSITPNGFVRFFKHISFIKEINPDAVIVCNNKLEDFLIPFFTRKKTIKEIHGSYQSLIHGYLYLMGEKASPGAWVNKASAVYKRRLYPLLLPRFDHAVFLTREDERLWNVPNGTVIHNFVEVNHSIEAGKEKSYFAIAAGRLERNKGFADLIKAWKIVSIRNPGLRLKIWGSGTQEVVLRALVVRLNLADNVELAGFSPRILEEYPYASVFVNTSFSEGFPLVLVEAQERGLPVISYDSPNGVGEIVNHGTDGLICPVGDIDGFADNVLRLAGDENLLGEMSRNAVENARRFDKDRIMRRWQDLLKANE